MSGSAWDAAEDPPEEPVEEGSGNLFADLALPSPEDVLLKAELARAISQIIEERRLTQAETAALLGVDQPKVSALVRGRLAGFSVERLLRFLNALGNDVEVVVSETPPSTSPSLTVIRC